MLSSPFILHANCSAYEGHKLTGWVCVQVSLWNFVKYNVVGGGDSALYGTESVTYYLRNGMLNLNVALPLALTAPLLPALWAVSGRGTRIFPLQLTFSTLLSSNALLSKVLIF